MIVCPNCNHQNPAGAAQCEACYTPLPEMIDCPSCGALVQADANFCGQCGFDLLQANPFTPLSDIPATALESMPGDPSVMALLGLGSAGSVAAHTEPPPAVGSALGTALGKPEPSLETTSSSNLSPAAVEVPDMMTMPTSAKTQLQNLRPCLLHVRSNVLLELPEGLAVMHVGKPNDRIPPDIDVSGFQDSEIVSRVHADIRMEADAYYLEDVGSANGTYVNNLPLPRGNRHRLRPGDRVSFGKGDLVTFLFQLH